MQVSVEKMPFKDGMLDLATAFETVFFWPDPKENFKEVNRILKDGAPVSRLGFVMRKTFGSGSSISSSSAST